MWGITLPSTLDMLGHKMIPASASSMNKMGICPSQFDAQYVGRHVPKIPFAPNEATAKGEKFHAIIETAAKNRTHVTDNDLTCEIINSHLDLCYAMPMVMIEKDFGWNDETQSREWRGRKLGVRADLFAKNGELGVYIDWKTGKVKTQTLQAELTAYILFQNYPDLTQITSRFIYVEHSQMVDYVFTRDTQYVESLFALVNQEWMQYPSETLTIKLDLLLAEYWDHQKVKEFPAVKNGLCKQWCQVTTCKHHGGRE